MDKDDKKATLHMVNEWVRFCDSKAGILLALQGIILTIIFTLTVIPRLGWNPAFVLFVVGCVLFGISIVIGLNAVMPILEVGQPTSKIFFGHVATYEKSSDYISEVNKGYDFETDILTQIWANSIVAWRKYSLIKSAILWGVIGFTSISISFMLK